MNKKSDLKIFRNNKENQTPKKVNKQNLILLNNKSFSSKNIFPHYNSYTKKMKSNNNNEENVIANILKTNNIKNDSNNEKSNNKKINKIKYYTKNSSTSINVINEYKEKGDFNYIHISEKVKPFIYKPQKTQEYSSHAFNIFHFLDISSAYRMIINILVDDDSLHSSNDLSKIFESIFLSLKSLGEINISNKDFLVCIFFQHFSCEETFKEIFPGINFYDCKLWNSKFNTFFCSYGDILSVNETPINILCFYKEASTFVEVYKFFYCYILNDLITLVNVDPKEIGKTILVVNWPNGKNYEKSSNKYHKSQILSNIVRICNNRNMILIPDINYCPSEKKDYFGYLKKYNFDSDKVYVNLIWDMISGYPIDHRFFFINMNFKLYLIIKEYYQNNIINICSNEYYHDYSFTIYLKKQIMNITIQKINQVKIEYTGLSSNLIDFFYEFSLKRGSEYANFFNLISFFFSCKNMNISKFFQKIALIFKLLSFFIEFFWLGLSLLISYAVFNETFGSHGNKMDYFGSFGYAIIVILLLSLSTIFIQNKPRIKSNKIIRNQRRDKDSYTILIVLYIIHYAYNIFFFVCIIIAVIHVDDGRKKEAYNNDYYIFKKKYLFLILILIILFMILPSLIRFANFGSKGFLYYLIFQFVNSPCFFHMPYLFTCIRNINSSKKNYESLYIALYSLLNGLLTIICLVFDTKRQRRMNFFYALSSILLILACLKFIFIIIGFCWQNKFNKRITAGQIPQYTIENSEYENKLNDNNSINNKTDDLNFKKNESKIGIKNFYEKQNLFDNELKNSRGYDRDYSSQIDIIPNKIFFFNNNSLEKNKNIDKSLKSGKIPLRNHQILNIGESQSKINYIKKDLNNEFNYPLNNQIYPETKENRKILLDNKIISNDNINNNNDLEGINYPYDSPTIDEENNDNLNYNNNYIMREVDNSPQFEPKEISLGAK